jgi:hypothetical protein
MAHPFTEADLEAYLDEALPSELMARVESALRSEPELSQRLAAINGRRDAGLHSVGEIWRRHRLTCPTREQLGSHLLMALDQELADYIRFHLEVSGCRACQANFDDLKRRQTDEPAAVDSRRKKYFQSSAGHLRRGQ